MQDLRSRWICLLALAFGMHAAPQAAFADNQNCFRCDTTVSCTYILKAKDFKKGGVTIRKPGTYCLAEDVGFKPKNQSGSSKLQASSELSPQQVQELIDLLNAPCPGYKDQMGIVANFMKNNKSETAQVKKLAASPSLAAITIASDNVTIDLKGHRLYQSNHTPGGIGIEILSGHKNISIINGSIQKFLGAAIHAFVDTSGTPPFDKITSLLFDNLSLIHNGGNGNETQGAKIATGLCLETSFTDALGPYSTSLLENPAYENVIIRNCQVNYNTLGGIFTSQTRDFVFEDSTCNHTFVDGSSPSTFITFVIGIQILGSENVRLTRSQINNTTHTDTKAFMIALDGLSLVANNNVLIEECQVNGTKGQAIFVGPIVGTVNHGLFLRDSQFNASHGIGQTGNIGFHQSDPSGSLIESRGDRIVNCQFNNNEMDVDANSFNFIILHGTDWITAKGAVVEQCQSIGHRYNAAVPQPNGYSWIINAFSYGCASGDPVTSEIASTRSIRWVDCTVSDLLGVGATNGFQFFAAGPADQPYLQSAFCASIEGCEISRIRTSSSDAGTGSAGILAFADPSSGHLRALCEDVEVKNCRIVDLSRSVPIANDTALGGIVMKGINRPVIVENSVGNTVNGIIFAALTTNGVVKSNEVSNCSQTGYLDSGNPTTSLWTRNLAFNNGSGLADNYVITWAGAPPVITGTLSAYPSTSQQWYNVSIAP